MSQLTIYLEDETLKKIEHHSQLENMSISKWVRSCVLKRLDDTLDLGYFKVFGSLADENSFSRPEQVDPANDSKRESFL